MPRSANVSASAAPPRSPVEAAPGSRRESTDPSPWIPPKARPPPSIPRDCIHRFKLWPRIKVSGAPPCYCVFWRRIAGFVSGRALKGWLVAAAAVWSSFRTARDFPGVRLITIGFPWRWSEHRAFLGRHDLARAPIQTASRGLLALVQIRSGRPALAPKSPKPSNAPPAPPHPSDSLFVIARSTATRRSA